MKKQKKRFRKTKVFILLVVIYMISNYTFMNLLKQKMKLSNDEFIQLMLSDTNHHLVYSYQSYAWVNQAISFLSQFNLEQPSEMIASNVDDVELSSAVATEENKDTYDPMELSKVTEYIKDPNPKEITNPKIYLYNSHQLENYNNSKLEIYNIKPNVMMTAYLLKDKLNNLGVRTIVEDSNITEFIRMNNWNHADSYKASRIYLLDAKSKYNSLTYFIDIHRDSAGKNITTKLINGKNYARLLFVVGLDHANYQANLKVAESFHQMINTSYPGLSRGVLKKQGKGVDGIYNQDIDSNVMLIEVGGVDNTIEEVLNTSTLLSELLFDFVGE